MELTQADSTPSRKAQPTPIDSTAAENIRFIRSTIEASQTFTMIPGKGCVVIGLMALIATELESIEALSGSWLPIWLLTALVAGGTALLFMESKASSQGLSLRRAVARKFFMTLAPAFATGLVLTAALVNIVPRELIAGVWLLTYGTGIAATGVFSVPAVIVAGLSFMALGALALVLPAGAAPAVLAAGFGGIHIVLGLFVARYHGG